MWALAGRMQWGTFCLLPFIVRLQGEDHRCLEHLARYLQDEFLNKRNEQVWGGGRAWMWQQQASGAAAPGYVV